MFNAEGTSLVAGVGEPLARRSQISNFDLAKDLTRVIDRIIWFNFQMLLILLYDFRFLFP